ncbi:hypothetical protein HAX54_047196 [Datura stramonium]|uniref:Uncharacterized protein n=1 Tax=Datura stramonium TaxID=4076 RepID=A0ABS8WLQ9_DATST|nr:hypothetical protein [Datura stramonium]
MEERMEGKRGTTAIGEGEGDEWEREEEGCRFGVVLGCFRRRGAEEERENMREGEEKERSQGAAGIEGGRGSMRMRLGLGA